MTAQPVATPTLITDPGVYADLDETTYHADPVPGLSLSCSGAKKLLPPSCPALFKHQRDHGQPHKAVFDFGHAAHKAVLGIGATVEVLDFPDYRTKAAQVARDAVYEAGAVPLLTEEAERVEGMAAAIKAHPIASTLFNPSTGKAEQSLFRRDAKTGVMLRSRLDWLPEPVAGQRLTVVDYKSCRSAEPDALSKAVAAYGYAMQAAWYCSMVSELGLDEAPEFRFVFQEKTAPYLVTVVELDTEAMLIGEQQMRQAIDLYAECSRTDTWPGYVDGVELIALPFWATNGYDVDVAL